MSTNLKTELTISPTLKFITVSSRKMQNCAILWQWRKFYQWIKVYSLSLLTPDDSNFIYTIPEISKVKCFPTHFMMLVLTLQNHTWIYMKIQGYS